MREIKEQKIFEILMANQFSSFVWKNTTHLGNSMKSTKHKHSDIWIYNSIKIKIQDNFTFWNQKIQMTQYKSKKQ